MHVLSVRVRLLAKNTNNLSWMQIKFDIVSEAELEKLRLQFQKGQLQIRIEPTTFDMRWIPSLSC